MTLTINGAAVDAIEFAYDGCHKVYLIFTAEDRTLMESYGYGEGDSAILPASELPRVWAETCALRFISSADLSNKYVDQCDDAAVVWS